MKKFFLFAAVIVVSLMMSVICYAYYKDWTVYGNLNGVQNAIDGNIETRADTGTDDYAGRWIEVDLGKVYDAYSVVQDHGSDVYDYPGGYLIEVSVDGQKYEPVYRGRGEFKATTANFGPIKARWVKITAEQPAIKGKWWSVRELRVLYNESGDSVPKAQVIAR